MHPTASPLYQVYEIQTAGRLLMHLKSRCPAGLPPAAWHRCGLPSSPVFGLSWLSRPEPAPRAPKPSPCLPMQARDDTPISPSRPRADPRFTRIFPAFFQSFARVSPEFSPKAGPQASFQHRFFHRFSGVSAASYPPAGPQPPQPRCAPPDGHARQGYQEGEARAYELNYKDQIVRALRRRAAGLGFALVEAAQAA